MTDAALDKAEITLDALLALGSDARVEVIDGDMVDMPAAGIVHHLVGGNIFRVIDPHVRETVLGIAFFDGLTYLMNNVGQGLKDSFVPDISYIRAENIPNDLAPHKPYPGVPDLAIEIISPGDDAEIVNRKVRTYLAKGTAQVWLGYPASRELHQYRRDLEPDVVRIYRRDDEIIDAESRLPGLQLDVTTIFALPPWAQKAGTDS